MAAPANVRIRISQSYDYDHGGRQGSISFPNHNLAIYQDICTLTRNLIITEHSSIAVYLRLIGQKLPIEANF